MFDLLLTIALLFFAYKGYQWYSNVQAQVRGADKPRTIHADEDLAKDPRQDQPGDEDDYIDYEEVEDDGPPHPAA